MVTLYQKHAVPRIWACNSAMKIADAAYRITNVHGLRTVSIPEPSTAALSLLALGGCWHAAAGNDYLFHCKMTSKAVVLFRIAVFLYVARKQEKRTRKNPCLAISFVQGMGDSSGIPNVIWGKLP